MEQLQTPNLDLGLAITVRTLARENAILRNVRSDHDVSSRNFARRNDISQRTVLNTLYYENLHPYYYQCVQCLSPVDYVPACSFVDGSSNINV